MHLDLAVFHAVNGLCGNWLLDRIAAYEENNYFFKGGIFLALYWWFWFAASPERRRQNRHIIVAAIIGTVLALALNRALAVTLPFRVRPMYASGIGYHAPSIAFPMDLEKWSSFPSDSATYWFALSFGLFRLSRAVGIAAMVYSTLWMCLVRLYLGIHYPSDLVAGAALGVGVAWSVDRVLLRRPAFSRGIMTRVATAERNHPQLFYAVAFIVSFELTMMFDDLRDFLRAAMHVLRNAGYAHLGEGETLFILAVAWLVLMGIAGSAIILLRRRRQQVSRELRLP
jgi:membrane-associated phospholipid phosphatase